MTFAVQSAFDVAFWFLDQASAEDNCLPPQKLHRLLFLAQAYFAVERAGAKLMPVVFVTALHGPVEPNVLRAFKHGRPNLTAKPVTKETDEFLYGIWQRFSHLNMDHLNHLVATLSGFDQMFAAGPGTEIPMQMLYKILKGKKPVHLGHTHNGKSIQRWIPGVKAASGERLP